MFSTENFYLENRKLHVAVEKKGVFVLACCLLLCLLSSNVSAQMFDVHPVFSVDQFSQIGAVGNSDVLLPGPVGGPPVVALPAATGGLSGGALDELDAFSWGAPADIGVFFSVDRATDAFQTGQAPLDVYSQALINFQNAGQAAGDIFMTSFTGSRVVYNQDVLGLIPAIPALPTGYGGLPDNLDSLDLYPVGTGLVQAGVPDVVFSVDSGNTYGLSGADLLDITSTTTGIPAVGFSALGLTFADDVDALHVDGSTGDIYFSLVPQSPSLVASGYSAASVLISQGSGSFSLFAPAASLGLLTTDNVDALAFLPLASVDSSTTIVIDGPPPVLVPPFPFGPPPVGGGPWINFDGVTEVPEPAGLLLLTFGSIIIASWQRQVR